MIRTSDHLEFARCFQLWKDEKGISIQELAEITEISIEEVSHLLSGRLPFSLSFLSKMKVYFPDFEFLHIYATYLKKRSVTSEETNRFWDKLKPALANPAEVSKVVIFYKNGSYREF